MTRAFAAAIDAVRLVATIAYAPIAFIVCAIAELGPDALADRVSWMMLDL